MLVFVLIPDIESTFHMKKLYLILAICCLSRFATAQLTVTATPVTPTICAGNSTSITASASPVGYSMSALGYNPQALQGINYLAQNGVDMGGLTVGNLDDGRWENITLPFTFRFYGIDYNAITVSTNGWVSLGSTNTTSTGLNFVLPNASAPNAVIHAITADLNFKTPTTSFIEYFESGSYPNRSFVVNFGSIKFFSGGGTADVQVIMYETSNIVEIHTGGCTNTTLPKAQGVENSTGTVASVVVGRNNTTTWAAGGMPNAVRFTPDVVTYTWSPSTGLNTTVGSTVIATPAVTTTYTINATNSTNGFTGSITSTITVSPASYVLAAIAGGPQICQNISVSAGGTNYRDGNCNLIANILPAGASPVSNSINTCIKLDTGATKRGTTNLIGARQYDIEPLIAASTSTANIILYYLQSEFDNFNLKASDSGHNKLPTAPADAVGITNLVIKQFHGTGTNPLNYTGGSFDFISGTSGFSVAWNVTRSWWEVTVPVSGFSGFYLSSKKSGSLPITLDYFRGVQINRKNQLNWKVYCTSTSARFEVERSSDGAHFSRIATLLADQVRCDQPFDYTDENPVPGADYYRIKIIDNNGKTDFSNTILLSLKTLPFELISLNPNIIARENAVLKINATERSEILLVINDFSGRRISTQTVFATPGLNQFTISTGNLSAGAYQISSYTTGQKVQTLRFIKQ